MTAPTAKARRGPEIRSALVLGAGSDIAFATVDRLAASGLSRAVLAARQPDEAAARLRIARPDLEVDAIAWDVTQTESHARLMAAATETLGTIDVVICAVGRLGHHAGYGMSAPDIVSMVETNFAGPAAAIAVAADTLVSQGHGSIVAFSSVAGVRPRRSNFVYGSTKAGLDSFARGLGDALTGTGVNVVVVRPGFVTSKMTEGLDPAPFATRPEVVAEAVVAALGRHRSGVVSVPAKLGPIFAVLGNVPAPVWRRIAGDR